jgi:mannosyltransferase
MAVLGLWGLARDSSMGNDEVATRWAALLSLRELAHLLRHMDAVHGLYYLLMHGWMVLGTSPVVMRIPSVISMIAAAALIVIIGRRLTGWGWAGLFAGLIMALTPTISYYAQTARSYALVLACVLAATLVLLHVMEAERASAPHRRLARGWLAYGALLTLGGYLNEMSLLVILAHAVTVLLARYGRPTVLRWAAASACGAALVAPLVVVSILEDGAVGWIPRPGWTDLRILFHDYFGATTVVAVLVAGSAVLAAVPPREWWPGKAGRAGAAPGVPWWSRGGISLPSVAAPLLVVPAAVLMLESLVARPLYVDRYVLYGEAGAALLAGAGIYRIGRWLARVTDRRMLVRVPGVVLCLCVLVLQLGPQHRVRTPESRRYDFGGPSRYVGAHAQPGDGVLFFNAFFRKARLGYPDDFRAVSDFALAVSPERVGNLRGQDKPFAAIRPLMLTHRRIWVIGLRPRVSLPPGLMRDESAVLLRDFSPAAVRTFRGMSVTLWLRHGP